MNQVTEELKTETKDQMKLFKGEMVSEMAKVRAEIKVEEKTENKVEEEIAATAEEENLEYQGAKKGRGRGRSTK